MLVCALNSVIPHITYTPAVVLDTSHQELVVCLDSVRLISRLLTVVASAENRIHSIQDCRVHSGVYVAEHACHEIAGVLLVLSMVYHLRQCALGVCFLGARCTLHLSDACSIWHACCGVHPHALASVYILVHFVCQVHAII